MLTHKSVTGIETRMVIFYRLLGRAVTKTLDVRCPLQTEQHLAYDVL